MAVLQVETVEIAFELFKSALDGSADFGTVDQFEFGDWLNPHVHIDVGHSEITPPFMEAFVTSQAALYRLVAQIKHGNADIRHLSTDELDQFQIKVKVTDGSSNFWNEIGEALSKIGIAGMDKLSPNQVIAIVLGTALLISGGFGFSTYLESRKTIRLQEIQSTERAQVVSALQYASHDQAETARAVINALKQIGSTGQRAVETASESNSALLRAASTAPNTVVNNTHISRDEAKELRSGTRSRTTRTIIEREMRVVDINTADRGSTSIVVEEIGSGKQYKVSFTDLLIQDRDIDKLHLSLRKRETVWLRLDIKEVRGETRSVEIAGVVAPPTDTKISSR